MKPQNAAALVAAGMLSVLIYPMLALSWLGKAPTGTETPSVAERSAEEEA